MSKLVKRTVEEGVADRDRQKFWTPSSGDTTYSIPVYIEELIVNTSSSAGTATLPNANHADGMTITVRTPTVGNALTLQDNDDSIDFGGDYTLDAANDSITLRAVKGQWVEVYNEIS
jgi:hypothetical protein